MKTTEDKERLKTKLIQLNKSLTESMGLEPIRLLETPERIVVKIEQVLRIDMEKLLEKYTEDGIQLEAEKVKRYLELEEIIDMLSNETTQSFAVHYREADEKINLMTKKKRIKKIEPEKENEMLQKLNKFGFQEQWEEIKMKEIFSEEEAQLAFQNIIWDISAEKADLADKINVRLWQYVRDIISRLNSILRIYNENV